MTTKKVPVHIVVHVPEGTPPYEIDVTVGARPDPVYLAEWRLVPPAPAEGKWQKTGGEYSEPSAAKAYADKLLVDMVSNLPSAEPARAVGDEVSVPRELLDGVRIAISAVLAKEKMRAVARRVLTDENAKLRALLAAAPADGCPPDADQLSLDGAGGVTRRRAPAENRDDR